MLQETTAVYDERITKVYKCFQGSFDTIESEL